MNKKPTNKSRIRGFVIIVILAAGAVIAAVVAGQLSSGQKAQIAGTRIAEEVRARAIAQACLDMMTSLAENAPTVNLPVPDPGDDFDVLLAGPDGTNNTADDHLVDGTTVTIPITNGVSWTQLDIPGSGGACAVRFDDNSDDGKLPLTIPSGDSGGEGGANDEPDMDRDLSVYVTAIGLYPAVSTDTGAYGTAHARVTLRRLVQLSNTFQPLAPALWANNINLGNNNDICGAGGAMASGGVTTDNNSCICGATQTNAPPAGSNPVTNGDTCNCPGAQCPPAQVTVGGPPPAPPVNVHWASVRDGPGGAQENMLDNEGWGRALEIDPVGDPQPTSSGEGTVGDPATVNDIGGAAICSIYGKVNGELYIWDRSDTNATATLHDMADGTLDGLTNPAYALVNVNAGSVTDCSSYTGATFPKPCNWPAVTTHNVNFSADGDTNGVADGPQNFVCAADQSPCWKLFARMSAGGNDGEVGFGALSMNEWTDLLDNEIEAQLTSADNDADLPNVRMAVADATKGIAFGPNGLCATSATSCSNCPDDGGFNFTDTLTFHNDHWHFGNDSDRRFLPEPAIYVLEVDPSERVALDDVGEHGTGPYHASIFSTGDIDVNSGASICCATCDCSALGASSAPGSCDAGGSFGAGNGTTISLQSTNAPAGSPTLWAGDPTDAKLSSGIALKAWGTVNLNGALVVGDVRAGTVDVSDICMIGNIVAYGGAGACSGSGTCSGANVCFSNNSNVAGDVESMTSIDVATGGSNNPTIWGAVVAKQNACFKNNARIDGIVMAGATIEFNNNALVINSTSSALGTKQVANAAMQTYMETAW